MKSKRYFIAVLFFLLIGCTNDSESDLTNPTEVEMVTYYNYVKNVMDSKCISCHGVIPSNGAFGSLTDYEQVKNAVLQLNLIDLISKNQGAQGMMPSGGTRLPQNTIDKIIQWRDKGFIEQ
jgi:hypothetical protein